MSLLKNSKHELFAQGVAKGLSLTKAYIAAGYAENNARANAGRLMTNDDISKRIEELKTAIADQVVRVDVGKRSGRVRILQDRVDRVLELTYYRAAMYANHRGGERTIQVADEAEEKLTRAEGFGDPPIDVFLAEVEGSVHPQPAARPGGPEDLRPGPTPRSYPPQPIALSRSDNPVRNQRRDRAAQKI
jgi:hypothetical protein